MDETDPNEATLAVIQRAVAGDVRAMRQLVQDLTPVIRASVGVTLARGHAPRRRERHQEVEDVTQMVLLSLFADRGRVLLQWDPSRGLSLSSFAAMLARRETVSVLRSPRRSPWTEDPTRIEDLDRNAMPRMGPESEAISRDMLAALSAAMRERLSPRGAEVFDLMFLGGHPADEVCAMTGLTPDAVYAWKSRIAKQLRELFTAFARAPSTIPPPVDGASYGPPASRLRPLAPASRPSAPASRPSAPASRPSAPASRPMGRSPELSARPVTGTVPKVARLKAKSARNAKRTQTGSVAVIPRAQPLRARASGSSSTPPPPSER